MLEQLIESKSNTKQAANRMGFLFSTFTLVAGLCLSGVLWSLFAMNVGIGDGEFDLTALIAPVSVVENKPEPVQKQENQTQENVTETTRQANILRMEEQPRGVPDTISVTPNTQKARPPVGEFKIKPGIERDFSDSSNNASNKSDGIGQTDKPVVSENDNEMPELTKPTLPVKPTTIIRKTEIINSQATYLPKPVYPAPAILVKASGAVNVQVTIDVSGKVISAKAISGHPLLRSAAENAARNARFSATYLNKQPVKVTGVIIYNFVRN